VNSAAPTFTDGGPLARRVLLVLGNGVGNSATSHTYTPLISLDLTSNEWETPGVGGHISQIDDGFVPYWSFTVRFGAFACIREAARLLEPALDAV